MSLTKVGMLKGILILELLLICGRLSAAATRPSIGTGLSGLDHWGTELPFLDAFKTSRPWHSGTQEKDEDGRRLDLDGNGWVRSLKPGQTAAAILLTGNGGLTGADAVSRFVVEYEGEGTIEYAWSARLAESSPGRDLIDVDISTEGAIELRLTSVNPSNSLRNIRVTAASSKAAAGEVFNPVFLDRLKVYKTLRFLGWMPDVEKGQRRWRERPTLQDAQWSAKGAPVELMVALANRLHADVWFSMPYAADDDYFRRFALALAKSLDPKLKVYAEYSNEVWNPIFPASQYAQKRGLALGLSQEPTQAQTRFYAKRAVEMFAIFEQALGKKRLVRVLSGQSGNTAVSETALSYGDTTDHVDALATAPYFGYDLSGDPAASAKTVKMSLDELMNELANTAVPAAKKEMLDEAAVARKYGLPLIAYEGGQHLVDFRPDAEHAPALDALYDAANRDPRMGALYTRNLQDWTEAGGGLFLHLQNCGPYDMHGRWGALEYINQPRAEAPKFDALMRFMEGK